MLLESTLGKETANISKISPPEFAREEWDEKMEVGSIIHSLEINSKHSSRKRTLEEENPMHMQSIGSKT